MTAFQPGDAVGCHKGLFERPGAIIGPTKGVRNSYDVDIVDLGRMAVHADMLRLESRMDGAGRERMAKLRAIAGEGA